MRTGFGIVAFLVLSGASPAMAASLTGTVSSQRDGAMEGVIVSAHREGSTITVSVVSDEKGRYHFPDGRLSDGPHDIAIRAVGYDLQGPKTVRIAGATKADVTLVPAKDLASQLTNSEWMVSMNKTEAEMDLLKTFYRCTSCHSVKWPLESKHTADAFKQVIHRMSQHASQSSPLMVQMRRFERDVSRDIRGNSAAAGPAAGTIQIGETDTQLSALDRMAIWLANNNLSKHKTWPFKLQTFPRPKGKATKVIYTEYKLTHDVWQPHDVILDKQGMVWITNFSEDMIGRLDPKTGKVTQFPYEKTRDAPTGNLDIEMDVDGNFWIGRMTQTGVARFNPKTEKFTIFPVPEEMRNEGTQQAMVATKSWKVDGKVWMNDAQNRSFTRLDVATGKIEPFWDPYKSRPAGEQNSVYGITVDKDNNLLFNDFSNAHIGVANAKTRAITLYKTPTDYSRPRRGEIDDKGVLWFAEWRSDKIGSFNPKTAEFKEWLLPVQYAGPYDAVADKNGQVWTGNQQDDLITRLDPATGEMVQFLMPHQTDVRRVFVDDSTPRPTFWVGSNFTASVFKLETLE